jgi:hypothetical protein
MGIFSEARSSRGLCPLCKCILQVFYYAVKAVVHPTAALFDAMTQTLKPLCVNALRRIFMMCDVDKVGCGLCMGYACLLSLVESKVGLCRKGTTACGRAMAPCQQSLHGQLQMCLCCEHAKISAALLPQDDALDDAELNAFQVRCFNAPLQPEELMGVKKVVMDKMPQVGC